MNEARKNVMAAHAAIGAAIRAVGPTMQIGELMSGMVALFAAQPGVDDAARACLALRVMIDVVRLCGRRRAHELVDMVADKGAGDEFS